MNNQIIRIGAIAAAIAVILGAFGAHKLKELLDENALATWETACRYQFYHALALVLTGILFTQKSSPSYRWAMRFFLAGIFLFSGSIYLLSIRSLLDVNVLWVGPVTPLGGLCFIVGWIFLAFPKNPEKTSV
ncbi:MAG: DUF423 domain-containing protein [Bacteroidetes bacterium]|nr:DUF423 domain-containing protein [Bacteroidota bacterium]